MQGSIIKIATARSAELSDKFQRLLSAEAVLDSNKSFLSIAYLNLSLEHREAILLLVDQGAYASAMALLRPLLEAFITGAWIETCAQEDVVREIASFNRVPPNVEKMAQQLRRTHDLGEWFESLRRHYSTLHDYTHGHRRQISRWLSNRSIEPRYDEAQMDEALRFADIVGILAAIHREKIAEKPIETLLDLLKNLMSIDSNKN